MEADAQAAPARRARQCPNPKCRSSDTVVYRTKAPIRYCRCRACDRHFKVTCLYRP